MDFEFVYMQPLILTELQHQTQSIQVIHSRLLEACKATQFLILGSYLKSNGFGQ